MKPILNQLQKIGDEALAFSERWRAILAFAREGAWTPSDLVSDYSVGSTAAFGHLLIEHGFGNAAVLTFLKSPFTFESLSSAEQNRALSIPYNNLVDWQLFPTPSGVSTVYVRRMPVWSRFFPLSTHPNALHSDYFNNLTDERPSANVKSLDDALIGVIAEWKRNLFMDLTPNIKVSEISSLFNTIIFVRAMEDERKWKNPSTREKRLLLDIVDGAPLTVNAATALRDALENLGSNSLPFESTFISRQQLPDKLARFNPLDRQTLRSLFSAFYTRPWLPYEFDFAVISKHALSRIYEKYVIELRDETSAQLKLFRELPTETDKRSLGAIYTPHFIARFFSRVLQSQVTPARFANLKVLDPAVGSGIFLRTLIERQCEPSELERPNEVVKKVFANSTGVDIDPDACNAARLSLSLLHLSLTGSLPTELNIINSEALLYAEGAKGHTEFDAIVTNPPFVKYERLQPEIQARVREYLHTSGSGRVDLYLALLKTAFDLCAQDGFVLYVLPEAFLTSSSAAELRRQICREFDVIHVVDLTSVSVFEGVGAYVILLVLQKKPLVRDMGRKCTVAKVNKNVATALTRLLQGVEGQGDGFSVFRIDQSIFREGMWRFAQPSEAAFLGKFAQHPRIVDLLNVNQGVVTGQDDVFILPSGGDLAIADADIWRPLLRDREMRQFRVPSEPSEVLFYPFSADGKKLTESQLRSQFKKTWKYLISQKEKLEQRKSVVSGRFPWWEPESPRDPQIMLSPKIVCPHLMLSPKFVLDESGGYLVSHAPVITTKDAESPSFDLLRFITAALNTPFCFWQLQYHSHKASRGYVRVESMTLKELRVPDPTQVPSRILQRVLECMKEIMLKRTGGQRMGALTNEVTNLIRDAFGFDVEQAEEMGWSNGQSKTGY